MIEISVSKGRKFMNAKRTGPGKDYYLIDARGNLQVWSQDIDGRYVLVVTAKKLAMPAKKKYQEAGNKKGQ